MIPLTVEALDRKHVEFVFRKFVEEYGVIAGTEVMQDLDNLLVSQADLWGVKYESEVQNAN
jgi:hypothetical protein